MTETTDKLDAQLRSLVPINGLSPQQQTEIINQSEVVVFKRGRHVFNRGDRDPYAFYVLEGEVELTTDGTRVKQVVGGTEGAKMALSQLQPRQMTATALGPVKLLRVDRELLDRMLTLHKSQTEGAMEVAEIDGEEPVDWMTRMLQSELFARIPAANIHRVFARLEAVEAKAGDIIVHQGAPGDFYYVIQRGRCAITRRASRGANEIRLAELTEGDSFGEEALVSGARRNATVSMITDGALMRLTMNDFVELIKTPALTSVTYEQALQRIEQGARWIDVRFAEELGELSVDGALNVPLNVLRMQSGQLDHATSYVVVCDSGTRSSAGAFLLTELGFEAAYLEGGLNATSLASTVRSSRLVDVPTEAVVTESAAASGAEGAAPAEGERLPPAVPPPSRRPAPAPMSEAVQAQVRASALSAELERAKLELEEALRARAEAEARAKASEAEIGDRFRLERERIMNEAARASVALREAQRLKLEAIEAKRAAEANAAKLRAERTESELRLQEEKARVDAEAREQLERARAQQEAAEAAARKREQARADALEQMQREAERRAEQELIRIDREAKRKLEAAFAEKEAAERARLAAEQAAAEEAKRLEREKVEELERIRIETERRIEEETNRRLERALAQKVAAEEARRRAVEEAAEAKIAEERRRRTEEAARAEEAFKEAQRLKREIEQAKHAAEREAEELRRAQEVRIREIEAQAEARMRENEAKLEHEFSKHAEALAQSQRLREELEANFAEERARIEHEAQQAQGRLDDARKISAGAEAAKRALEKEVQRQLALREQEEQRLRQELEEKLHEERRTLERQWAQGAQQLERAQREKEEAEAARRTAQGEAKRIIEERERAHKETLAAEEARIQAERAAMAAQARRLDEELAQARLAKEETDRLRAEVEAQARALSARDGGEARERALQEQIRRIDERVQQANHDLEAAERAQEIATEEQAAQDSDLAKKLEETERLRRQIELETEQWLAAQQAAESRGEGGAASDVYGTDGRVVSSKRQSDTDSAVRSMLDEVSAQLQK